MADDRIKDLPGEVSTAELNALIDTLYLAVDDTTFTDAEKMLLKSIMFDGFVTSNSNNYQAMTPRAFYNNIMTTTRRGVGTFANDTDIGNKAGEGLLRSEGQPVMQAQWLIDWFESNPVPKIYSADNLETPRTMSFDVHFNNPINPTPVIVISPELPTGYRFDVISFSYVAWNSATNKSYGFDGLEFTGSVTLRSLTTLLRFQLSADGREMAISTQQPIANAYVSMKINTIIVPV